MSAKHDMQIVRLELGRARISVLLAMKLMLPSKAAFDSVSMDGTRLVRIR